MTETFYNSQSAAASFPGTGALQLSKREGKSWEPGVDFLEHRA